MAISPDEVLVTKPCSRPAASRSAVVEDLLISKEGGIDFWPIVWLQSPDKSCPLNLNKLGRALRATVFTDRHS